MEPADHINPLLTLNNSDFIETSDPFSLNRVNARWDQQKFLPPGSRWLSWEAQSKARNSDINSIKISEFPERRLFDLMFGHSDNIRCWKPLHRIQWQQKPCLSCEPFFPKSLDPLDECIVAILWEVSHCTLSRDLFTASESTQLSNLWDVAAFLRSAASYQLKFQSVSICYHFQPEYVSMADNTKE